MILAGDIGGTKTNIARFEWKNGNLVKVETTRTFPSGAFGSLEEVLGAFLAEQPGKVAAASFGIAGPVVEGRSRVTNLTWDVDSRNVAAFLGIPRVTLMNDLEANAWGIPALQPDELFTLQEGTPRIGNAALVSAGTGLGEAILFWNGTTHIPSASEGGHVTFAPRDAFELELRDFLAARYAEVSHGHVSYERILCGRGFTDLYDFLVSKGWAPSIEVEKAVAATANPTPIISQAGLARTCGVCVEVMDRFVEIYGSAAGNMALKAMAVNGVYIGGGIAPRILPWMRDGRFLEGFLEKGRFRQRLLEQVPVKVILNAETALLGAARRAGLELAGAV